MFTFLHHLKKLKEAFNETPFSIKILYDTLQLNKVGYNKHSAITNIFFGPK